MSRGLGDVYKRQPLFRHLFGVIHEDGLSFGDQVGKAKDIIDQFVIRGEQAAASPQ